MKFSPCKGGSFCSEEGAYCQGGGRSHLEISETRVLMNGLVEFVQNRRMKTQKILLNL